METWKPVKDYEGLYEVSDLGRVRSTERIVIRRNGSPLPVATRLRKPTIVIGYHKVNLSKDGKVSYLWVHRLVASAFIGNAPSPIYQVNHKNSNRLDNRPSNLEWCTVQENLEHGFTHGHGIRKKVIRLTDGATFSSLHSAAISVGGRYNGVSDVCSARSKTYHGHKFAYLGG